MSSAVASTTQTSCQAPSWTEKLNGVWHREALWFFMAIVLAHWGEHLVQTIQIYWLHWPVPEARGILGLWFPALVTSELLHYGYALIMLVCLWMLRTGFVGASYRWWMLSFGIQFWHHIEHALLQGQVLFQHNLFGSPIPLSLAQLFIPRVELHLFYNTAVFVPMVIAMFLHMFPLPGEEAHTSCSCSWEPQTAQA